MIVPYEKKMARLRPRLERIVERERKQKQKEKIFARQLTRLEKETLLRQRRRDEERRAVESRARYCSCGRKKGIFPYTPGCMECKESEYRTKLTRKSGRKWEDRGPMYWDNQDTELAPLSLFDQHQAEAIRATGKYITT